MARRLTDKQRLWVEAYLENGFNATQAAKTAGYKGSYDTLRAIGYENRAKPHLREAVEERLEEAAMSANEVLARLSMQARANIAEFVDPISKHNFLLDVEALEERGHLVKEVRYTKDGPVVKLHNAQRALELLGKHHRLFAERVEHTDAEGDALFPVDKLIAALRAAEEDDEG